MVLLVFVFSCKKDQTEKARPKTVADFEIIMATDLNFNAFITASLDLEDIMLAKYKPTILLQNNSLIKEKTLTFSEQEALKKVKNNDEKSFLYFSFLAIHCNYNND